MSDHAILDAVFGTLLPGDALYPPGDGLSLAARAGDYPHFAPALADTLAALPPDFAARDALARTEMLQSLERERPALFAGLVTAAYSLYYTNPAVLAVIAEAENYTPRAPQPEGYRLEPFDPAAVAVPAGHAPSWRPADDVQESAHG